MIFEKKICSGKLSKDVNFFIPEKYKDKIDTNNLFSADILFPNLDAQYSEKGVNELIEERENLGKKLFEVSPVGNKYIDIKFHNEIAKRIMENENLINKLHVESLREKHNLTLKKYFGDVVLIKNSLIMNIAAYSHFMMEERAKLLSDIKTRIKSNRKGNDSYIKGLILSTINYDKTQLVKKLLKGAKSPFTGIEIYLDYIKSIDESSYKFIYEFITDSLDEIISETAEEIQDLKKKYNVDEYALKSTLLPQVVYPDNFYRAKDKVTNSVYSEKLTLGHFKPVITGTKGKNNFGALVKVDSNVTALELNNDGMGGHTIAFFHPLDEEARIIFDVVANLYNSGNKIITPKDILKVKRNNKNAQISASTEQDIIRIVDSLAKRQVVILSNDNTAPLLWGKVKFKPEKNYYNKLGDKMEGALLPVEKYSTPYMDEDGNIKEKDVYWKILKMPVLYEYAQLKGQISATPMKYLEPTKRGKENFSKRSGHSDSLRIFLATEIDTMNKNPKSYSNLITCERLYKVGGVDEMNTEAAKKDKRSKVRKQTEQILNLLLKNGADNFSGYEWHKKLVGRAQTYYSLEIILPPK